VQGQKDKMLAMRAAWTSALDDDFDFDADDAIEEDEEAPAVVETAAAKRRRLSGPPETRAEAERLQARLNNVNTALEAVEASVFCAEQRLAALQAENRALWGHYADAAAAVSGSECHIREGDFDAAAALQGITAAMAEAEEAAQAAEAAEAAEATTEATAEAAEATAKASPAVSSAASSSVNTEAANGTLATPLGSPSISHV
jgi:chromosome segregation ATPase